MYYVMCTQKGFFVVLATREGMDGIGGRMDGWERGRHSISVKKGRFARVVLVFLGFSFLLISFISFLVVGLCIGARVHHFSALLCFSLCCRLRWLCMPTASRPTGEMGICLGLEEEQQEEPTDKQPRELSVERVLAGTRSMGAGEGRDSNQERGVQTNVGSGGFQTQGLTEREVVCPV